MCGNIDVPVDNKEFDVKFIRPISITDATAKFVDGVTTTAPLKLTFVDWRGYNFTGTRVPTANYFTYYGVKSIALDIPNAKTNLNNNWNDKLSELTSKIKLLQQRLRLLLRTSVLLLIATMVVQLVHSRLRFLQP